MNKPYIATEVAEELMHDWKLRPGISPEEVKEIVNKITDKASEQDDAVITATTLMGYLKTKQAYKFHPNLVGSLGGTMDFRVQDLHLPFLSMYFDIEGCKIKLDSNDVLGVYVHVCMPPNNFLFFSALVRRKDGRVVMVKAAMEYSPTRSLEESINGICGGMSGDRALCRTVCLLLSYISSEEPDVMDGGKHISLRKIPGRKPVPSAVHVWNVGFHYVMEREHEESIPLGGTHASPKAHLRRGHWHTYLCGKGRTERRVRWVNDCQVGEGENNTAVRPKK